MERARRRTVLLMLIRCRREYSTRLCAVTIGIHAEQVKTVGSVCCRIELALFYNLSIWEEGGFQGSITIVQKLRGAQIRRRSMILCGTPPPQGTSPGDGV